MSETVAINKDFFIKRDERQLAISGYRSGTPVGFYFCSNAKALKNLFTDCLYWPARGSEKRTKAVVKNFPKWKDWSQEARDFVVEFFAEIDTGVFLDKYASDDIVEEGIKVIILNSSKVVCPLLGFEITNPTSPLTEMGRAMEAAGFGKANMIVLQEFDGVMKRVFNDCRVEKWASVVVSESDAKSVSFVRYRKFDTAIFGDKS